MMTLREITLPDSGAVLRVKRIPPMTLMAIERAHPDPRPPLQEVNYGNGSVRREENPLDPAYQVALAEHSMKKNLTILQAFIRLGVEVEVDVEKVAATRADMLSLGVTLPDDDKYVYVAHVLCESNADLSMLRVAIEGGSIPTEAAVAERAATFQGDVSGNGHLEMADAEVGS